MGCGLIGGALAFGAKSCEFNSHHPNSLLLNKFVITVAPQKLICPQGNT